MPVRGIAHPHQDIVGATTAIFAFAAPREVLGDEGELGIGFGRVGGIRIVSAGAPRRGCRHAQAVRCA